MTFLASSQALGMYTFIFIYYICIIRILYVFELFVFAIFTGMGLFVTIRQQSIRCVQFSVRYSASRPSGVSSVECGCGGAVIGGSGRRFVDVCL